MDCCTYCHQRVDQVSRSGTETIDLLATKEDIQATLPDVYATFSPRLRCVIDCTEVPIERPRDLELQAQTWPDYKKHDTLKILVAIAPNDSMTFVSVPYGGRASDRHIVQDTGFSDKVSPTDKVMAELR